MNKNVDWQKIELDFKEKGFLSAGTSLFQEHFRTAMSDWFKLAEELNELGQRIYVENADQVLGKSVMSPISLVLLMMPRCLSGFQGAIILAERGLGIEAQSLIRNIYETTFWMGYISQNHDDAIPQLRRETLTSEIGLFETSLKHLNQMSPDTKEEVERRINEMREDRDALPKPPKIEKLAALSGYEKNYFFYKELSGAATHLSMKSIHIFLEKNADGDPVGHQIGPDEEAVGKAVWLGCRAMVLAIDVVQRTLNRMEYDDELSRLNERILELEPFKG